MLAVTLLAWGIGGLLLGAILLVARLRSSMLDGLQQVQALVAIRPIIGPSPLPFGGWAIDPRLGQRLVETIFSQRPGLVVECGSGTSTVLMARCLKEVGGGKLISLEHDSGWAAETRRMLDLHDVAHIAEVIEAPLAPWSGDGVHSLWYSQTPARELALGIDLLFVDGPPGKLGPMARYPAVPELAPYLNNEAVIVLDDAGRRDERQAAHLWEELLNGDATHVREGRGAWIFKLHGEPAASSTRAGT